MIIKKIEKENYYDSDLGITINIDGYETQCEKFGRAIIENYWFRIANDIDYMIMDKNEYIDYTLNYFIKEYDKKGLDSGSFKKQKLSLENINEEYIILDNTKDTSDPNRLIIKDIEPEKYKKAVEYFCKLGFVKRSLILYWLMQREIDNISEFTKEKYEKINENYKIAKQILESENENFKRVIMVLIYNKFDYMFNFYADEYNTNDVNCDLASELEDYGFIATQHCEYLIYPNGEREDINSTRYSGLYNEFLNLIDYYGDKTNQINVIDPEQEKEIIEKEYNEFIKEIEKQENPINLYLDWFNSVVDNLREEYCD